MSRQLPNDERPLSLPLRLQPVLHLPLPNIPSQASRSIRNHITNALRHDEATRQPIRVRKTTPPVIKGYVPVELRPIPPRTIPAPVDQSAGPMAAAEPEGEGLRMDPAGCGAVFGVEVGRRTGQDVGVSQPQPWSTVHVQGGEAPSSVSSWPGSGSVGEGSHCGDQSELFEIVDPTTYHLGQITQHSNASGDSVSQPPLFPFPTSNPVPSTSSQPRAFPVSPSHLVAHVPGHTGSAFPFTYPIYGVTSVQQPYQPLYPSYAAPPPPPDLHAAQEPNFTLFPPPSVSSVPTQITPPNLHPPAAPPPNRRNRIPTPIVIPSQSQNLPLGTAHLGTGTSLAAGPGTSLLTPHTTMPIGPFYPEPITPYLVTPFEPTFPNTSMYPSVVPSNQYSLSAPTFQFGTNDPYAFKFPADAFPQAQAGLQLFTSSYPYPDIAWSDSGLPDLITSAGLSGGMFGPSVAPAKTHSSSSGSACSRSTRSRVAPAAPEKLRTLQSSFLLSPIHPPLLPPSNTHPPSNPKPTQPPSVIVPPKLLPLANTSPSADRPKRKTKSAAKPSTPVKYVFPESYEFADLLEEVAAKGPEYRKPVHRAVRAHADMTERFGCDDCSKTFTRPSDAQRHYVREHVPYDEWEFACKLCDRRFVSLVSPLPPLYRSPLSLAVALTPVSSRSKADPYPRKDHLLLHTKRGRCPVSQASEPLTEKPPPPPRDPNDPLGRPSKKAKKAE